MNYWPSLAKTLRRPGEIDREALLPYPSILFGLETALLHFRACSLQFWHTPFSKGKAGIPINGLIWMGSFDEMYRRIEEKMQKGFRCIKLKIGAIDFEKELELLAHIRRHFTPEQIELRVDANGAFTPTDALDKLQRLSEFHLHSIEQPIRAGQWKEMSTLCASAPFPIALDEELIGINQRSRKIELLEIHPTAIYHSETLPSRRNQRVGRMDGTGSGKRDRFVDYLGLGIKYRTKRYRPMVRYPATYASTRPWNRVTVYRQHKLSATYRRRLPVVSSRRART